jgi:hypothetical protein
VTHACSTLTPYSPRYNGVVAIHRGAIVQSRLLFGLGLSCDKRTLSPESIVLACSGSAFAANSSTIGGKHLNSVPVLDWLKHQDLYVILA